MPTIIDYFKPENQAEKMNLKLLFLLEKTMRPSKGISGLVKLVEITDRNNNFNDAPGMYRVWKQIEKQKLDKEFYTWLKKYLKERNVG